MGRTMSSTVDHLNLGPGAYVPRKDTVGPKTVVTFDLCMVAPSREPVMNTAEVHAPEHLGTTFLRSHADFGAHVPYLGPMGYRTGLYPLLRGDYEPADILPLLCELFRFVTSLTGEVPGATARDCSNYLDMNLPMAKWEVCRYLEHALNTPRSP